MRIRSLFFCLPALALLAACSKTDAPVQIYFVGANGFTSGNRTVGAGDTVLTRAYARSYDQDLKSLRIEVTYEPGPAPIRYPVPTSSFDPANAPKAKQMVYLDSLVNGSKPDNGKGTEVLFPNGLMARTTSGNETWTYTATDVSGQTAARGYHLTVHKADSAAVFHSYPLILRPLPYRAARPASVRDSRRVFLNLRYGLLLPKYAVLNNQGSLKANQILVDLVCVATRAGNAVSLAVPIDTASRVTTYGNRWTFDPSRAAEIHALGATATQFSNASAAADFEAAFQVSTPYKYPSGALSNRTTGPLAAGQVIAFKAFDESGTPYYGLLQVSALTLGTNPVLTCQVKVPKY